MRFDDIRRLAAKHPAWLALGTALSVVALGEALAWPFLRLPVERLLAARLERRVVLGDDFGIRFVGPLRLRGNLLVVGAPPDGPVFVDKDGKPRDLVRAEGFALSLPWSSLLRLARGDAAPLRVNNLEVARLDAGLRRDAAGRANWSFGKPEPPDAEPNLPRFERLAVAAGRIGLDDARLRLAVDATVRTLEGSGVAATQAAGLEIKATGRYGDAPLAALIRSSGLLALAASVQRDPAVPVTAELRIGDTELVLEGRGRDLLHLHSFNGAYRIKGKSLARIGDVLKVALPTTGAFSSAGRIVKDGGVWNVLVDRFAVGESRLHGRFRYDRGRQPPLLSGELGGTRLDLPDLIPALGGRPRDAPKTPRDRLLPRREFDIPALGFMNADVAARIDRFTLGTAWLEPMEPLKARLVLRDKVLSLEGLQAHTARGDLRGRLALDARKHVPFWTIDVDWSGVDLERFIKARDVAARAQPGAKPGYISGVLGGRAKLQGRGRSTAAMLGSLDGSSQWWISNGRISRLLVELIGLDIAQSLGMIVGGDQRLRLRCAVASLAVADGVMRPDTAVIETDLTTTRATGAISLADERLALRFTAHPRNVSPLALRSPVRVEGSFADPDVILDPVSIGGRAAAAAALAALTPAAALLALIDLGDPEKAVCRQALERMESKATSKARRPER